MRILVLMLAVACGSTAEPQPTTTAARDREPEPEPEAPHSRRRTGPEPEVATAGEDETVASPSVRAMAKTPFVGAPPRVRITRPRDGQLIRGDVQVQLDLLNWPLGESGNRIVVKIDDQEQLSVRDVSRFSLNERYATRFEEDLSEGTHVMRIVLARANHESVKLPSAFAMVTFHHRSRSEVPALDPRAPMLTYLRPQGCASDNSRLLDFFITNLNDLSPNAYRVAYAIDDVHRGILSGWDPYRIDDLSDTEHTVRLTLLGPDGERVPGRFNDTIRTIRSSGDCPDLGLIPDERADEDDEVL